MAARNFKLFLGCLGNGVTVCNSAVMEDGDFKKVAHISNEGKITWYVSEDYPPADALASIRACAEQERVKYETWLNGLSPAARREYQLERLPLPELLEELRKAKEALPTLWWIVLNQSSFYCSQNVLKRRPVVFDNAFTPMCHVVKICFRGFDFSSR